MAAMYTQLLVNTYYSSFKKLAEKKKYVVEVQ